MKRAIAALGVIGLMVQSGCLAVSAKNNRYCHDHEVVAVDGQVYLINLDSGKVQRIDTAGATPFEPPASNSDCDEGPPA